MKGGYPQLIDFLPVIVIGKGIYVEKRKESLTLYVIKGKEDLNVHWNPNWRLWQVEIDLL